MKEMTDIDFEILNYISNNDFATLEELKRKFANMQNLEHRLKLLSVSQKDSPAVIKETFETEGIGARLKRIYLGQFSLTEYGNILLQDYNRNKKKNKTEIWLKNAWIPIIVSLVSYLLLNCIIPMLLNLLR